MTRIAALLAALVAGGVWLAVKLRLARSEGGTEALRGAKDDDNAAASRIRSDVRTGLDDRVRSLDDAGYRTD